MGLENIRNLSFIEDDVEVPATLYNILLTLCEDIVAFGEESHEDDGTINILTGDGLGGRPSAGVAGRVYYDETNEKLYVDLGTTWGRGFAVDPDDIDYTLQGVPVDNVKEALDRLFAMVGVDAALGADAIEYTYSEPVYIIGQNGDVETALQAVCEWLFDLSSSNIAHGDGTVNSAITTLLGFVTALSQTSGASTVGINDSGLANIDAADVQAAIQDIDDALTALGELPSPPASSVINTSPDTYFGAVDDVQSELNKLGTLMRTMQDYVIFEHYIPGTVATNSKAYAWTIPFQVGVGNIVDMEAINFTAVLASAPSSTVSVKFIHTRCANITELTIPQNSTTDRDAVTEYDDIDVGDTFWVSVTGSSGTDLIVSFVLRLTRSYE